VSNPVDGRFEARYPRESLFDFRTTLASLCEADQIQDCATRQELVASQDMDEGVNQSLYIHVVVGIDSLPQFLE
jgi:hypothetical protein